MVETMIPLVGFSELERMRTLILAELAGEEVPIGTMIELPRACAVAGKIAQVAGFFSFGTNDLTQLVCGISRDDAEERFLSDYLKDGILRENPFETLDQDGVGELIHMASQRGRETNPHLKLGVCGEHGSDPKSVFFFHQAGLDYVSCSPSASPARASPPLRPPSSTGRRSDRRLERDRRPKPLKDPTAREDDWVPGSSPKALRALEPEDATGWDCFGASV
jgi:pyruvate, orthophosphate dikinase